MAQLQGRPAVGEVPQLQLEKPALKANGGGRRRGEVPQERVVGGGGLPGTTIPLQGLRHPGQQIRVAGPQPQGLAVFGGGGGVVVPEVALEMAEVDARRV